MSIPTVPAGTFVDVGVRNHSQDGDETLELWLRQTFAGSGGAGSPAPGVMRGASDFSEFAVGAGLPAGLTHIGQGAPAWEVFDGGGTVGRYLEFVPTFTDSRAVVFDAWSGLMGDSGEIVARVWSMDHTINNRRIGGGGFCIDGVAPNAPAGVGGSMYKRGPGDYEANAISQALGAGGLLPLQCDTAAGEPVSQWIWIRMRRLHEAESAGTSQWKIKIWTGEWGDEPGAWDCETNGEEGVTGGPGVGWLLPGAVTTNDRPTRVAFLSWSSEPVAWPPVGPDDIPSENGPWFLSRSVPVSAGADQVVRLSDLDPGQNYDIALRYRRGLLYNPGAEDTSDPATWPSISRGTFTTTVDPAVIESAVWTRTGGAAERVTLTIEPNVGALAQDILVYRRTAAESDYTLLDTIAGPHVDPVTYVDETIAGEVGYFYAVATGIGPQGPATRVWSGPATTPVYNYQVTAHSGYTIGFIPGDVTLETELHDSYDDAGDNGPLQLRATAAAGATEVISGFLNNVPPGEFQLEMNLRHKLTSFAVDDFGEFGVQVSVFLPEEE
jgi:hypothetical protein